MDSGGKTHKDVKKFELDFHLETSTSVLGGYVNEDVCNLHRLLLFLRTHFTSDDDARTWNQI